MIYYIIGWLICGGLTTGLTFAIQQRQYPYIAKEDYKKDLYFSYVTWITGLIGLIVILGVQAYDVGWRNIFKYGFKYW